MKRARGVSLAFVVSALLHASCASSPDTPAAPGAASVPALSEEPFPIVSNEPHRSSVDGSHPPRAGAASLTYLGGRTVRIENESGRFEVPVDAFRLANRGLAPLLFWDDVNFPMEPRRRLLRREDGSVEEGDWVDGCPWGRVMREVPAGAEAVVFVRVEEEDRTEGKRQVGILVEEGPSLRQGFVWSEPYEHIAPIRAFGSAVGEQ
ncbi:MAG TPA: hypothetical protein ENJ09_05985 [Planctomycetes bacterium]|nr:hypothetical protein [Planctomycetota bacterium]